MTDCFIGRVPILYRDHSLQAYELLYRPDADGKGVLLDPTAAASQLIVDTFLDVGIEKVAGRNPVYIPVTPAFAKHPDLAALPPKQVVLVLPAAMEMTDAVQAGVASLKEQGFALALSGYRSAAPAASLVHNVDAVLLDAEIDSDALAKELVDLEGKRVIKVASGVTTMKRRLELDSLDFDCFHGHFLTSPEVVSGKRLASNRLAVLDLVSKLADPTTALEDIERLVSADPALSLRVLRFVNSPVSGLSNEVDSIHQAIVLIGRDMIKSWAMLMAIAGLDDTVPELLKTMFVRARFCERFAETGGLAPKEAYFTAGLFSLMDALMGIPITDIVDTLPFTDELKEGLTTKEGPYGRALRAVELLEVGMPNGYDQLGLVASKLSSLYLEAVDWAETTLAATGQRR